jgi:hypothetical protein
MNEPDRDQTGGLKTFPECRPVPSEDAQHNRADEGNGHIGRYNAQSACESHGNVPFFHVAARIESGKIPNRPSAKKSAPLSVRRKTPARRG